LTPLIAVLLVLGADAPRPPSDASVESTGVSLVPESQRWSVIAIRTLGAGKNLLEGGGGFPGFHATYLRGVAAGVDLGGRFAVNYGFEGQVNRVNAGIKLQAMARLRLMDNGRVSLGASFAPGLLFYFPPLVGAQVGFALPLGLTLGLVASERSTCRSRSTCRCGFSSAPRPRR
jgi:hypothetical protein